MNVGDNIRISTRDLLHDWVIALLVVIFTPLGIAIIVVNEVYQGLRGRHG